MVIKFVYTIFLALLVALVLGYIRFIKPKEGAEKK